MTIRPIGNRILAEPLPQKEISDGGLFLPPAARDQLRGEFKVVSVGMGKIHPTKKNGLLRIMPDVRPGNRILANLFAGVEVNCDQKKMRLMDADAIIAVLD